MSNQERFEKMGQIADDAAAHVASQLHGIMHGRAIPELSDAIYQWLSERAIFAGEEIPHRASRLRCEDCSGSLVSLPIPPEQKTDRNVYFHRQKCSGCGARYETLPGSACRKVEEWSHAAPYDTANERGWLVLDAAKIHHCPD